MKRILKTNNTSSNQQVQKHLGIGKDKIPPNSAEMLKAIAKNISSGALIDEDVAQVIEKDFPTQKGKVDVLMQAMVGVQSKRLSNYLQTATLLEDQVFTPAVLNRLPAADKIKLIELAQKNIESISKFVDSKSSSPPNKHEIHTTTVNMDNRSVHTDRELSETTELLNSISSQKREKIRNIMNVLAEKLADPLPEVKVEPVPVKKSKNKVLIKRRKR